MRKYLVCAFLLFACVAFPEYSPAAKISAEDWIAAPTDSMAGRYGAFMEGYRYRKLGHLSLISDGVDVYSITFGENIFLGRPDIYSAYNYKEKFGWNGVERTYEFTDKGTRLTINESGFAPGFLYETDDSVFRWCWLEQLTGQGYILPLESGNSFRTEGERYIKALHGDLKNNWMLVSFSGSRQKHDCPLLFIFENHPSKIEVVTHEFVDIRFEGSAGKIVVMPLYGVKKIEHEKSAQWKESFPAQIAAECDAWARRMEHYPVVCREEYAFNEKDNSLAIRNVFEFISFKNSESKPLAPISPMLSVADQTGYPVKIQGQVLKAEYPTNYGPMNYAEGPSVTYTVPSCSYVDRVLAPVRVKGVRNIDQVEKALEKYISNPNYLWPGDHDYFPDDVMDTMHNLRLLSWASWSLSPSKRKKAIKQLAEPGLERIGDENNRYFFFRDPVAGRDYARDSTIFAQRGKTSYDSDWYNGFQVAGLWAYTYFGNREHGLSLARRHWKEFSALYRYMEIYHDWAMSCAVTDPRGNLTDYDCMRNGWNGVIAYARLAKELGKEKEYLTAKYFASKNMVTLYAQWNIQKFFYEWASSYSPDKNSSNLQYPLKDITGISHIDGYGNLGLEGPDDRSPYHLNANIAEHALLLSDFGLNDEVGHAVNLLTSKGDDISSLNPETYKISSSSWAAANAAGGRYFYFIDPVLFARSVNLNEPLDQLLSYRPLKWLSGQAVEGMLVGSRPMLEIPADVIFMGNEWNEKDRSLEFSLKSKDQNAVTSEVVIRNCDGIKKIGSDIAFQYDSETRKAFFSIELKGKETVKVFFK